MMSLHSLTQRAGLERHRLLLPFPTFQTRVRSVYLPPEDFSSSDLPIAEIFDQRWHRCHRSRFGPIHYSCSPGHRFSPDLGAPLVIYLASSPKTALLEVFGDQLCSAQCILSRSIWSASCLTELRTEKLRIVDLTDEKHRFASGVELGTLMSYDISACKKWATAFFNHPAAPEAIRYFSRFSNEPCLCLSETAAEKLTAVPSTLSLDFAQEAIDLLDDLQIALV